MKRTLSLITVVISLALVFSATGVIAQATGPQSAVSAAGSLGTAFTYQGQLKNASGPVTGSCDFQFSLWDSLANVSGQIGTTQSKSNVALSNGLFTVQLDFGQSALGGDARWLGIAVACPAGNGNYTPLDPRQPLTAAPYALHAADAWSINGNSGMNSTTNFLGTTDNVTLTLRVSNTVAYRLVPAVNSYGQVSPNIVGGSSSNSMGPVYGTTIAGGTNNQAYGNYAAIGGGIGNAAGSWYTTVSGGTGNNASGFASTIAGGASNTASGTAAFVGGGGWNATTPAGNRAIGNASMIGGGISNTITSNGTYASIGGGISNTAVYTAATIGGGASNVASNSYATIGGGLQNTANGWYALVGGGAGNNATNADATVSGGTGNWATGNGAFVGGGGWDGTTLSGNQANGDASIIGGGEGNTASSAYAVVCGGKNNTASGNGAFVGGGGWDGTTLSGTLASGDASTIGGGLGNSISVTGKYAFIGGGESNQANNVQATVGGGWNNIASSVQATIGGGGGNTASGIRAVVGGGWHNTASASYATVPGGYFNTASASFATVLGGRFNTASAWAATVPGGDSNIAQGDYSFAAGQQAQALHAGAFVWADSTSAPFASTANNQFLVRASGGITLYTNSTATSGAALYPGSGSWNTLSDRAMKQNFAEVDARTILAQVSALPIMSWNYKTQDANIRHIGPMAQDFAAAFQVGENNTTISTVDAQGVALAAIQGLYQVVQDKDATIVAQQKQIADLQTRLSKVEQNATASNPSAQPEPFNVSNLMSVVALLGCVWLWREQRRSRSGGTR